MRTVIVLIIFITSLGARAQSPVASASFVVKGNCEDCEARIENAADIKGVKILRWDQKTGVATVTYSPEKTSVLKIQEAIAAAGYDAGAVKGDNNAYNKLPKCCKYRDARCEEKK
jgi:copper chaperone CopZ